MRLAAFLTTLVLTVPLEARVVAAENESARRLPHLPSLWSLEHQVLVDVSAPVIGGLRRGAVARGLWTMSLTADLERGLGWSGVSLSVVVQGQRGDDGSEAIGDLQAYSNIDAENFFRLSELWLETSPLDGPATLKFGKLDANADFAAPENGSEFLNSSMGFSPTVFALPTYPSPVIGANLFVELPAEFHVGVGIYDAGEVSNADFLQASFDRSFAVAELAWSPEVGRLAVGAWRLSGDHPGHSGRIHHGTAGVFSTFDRTWWQAPSHEGRIASFVQVGWSDEDVAEIDIHWGGGLLWEAPLASRLQDSAGLAWTTVGLSRSLDWGFEVAHEKVLELFYRAQLWPALAVKPDVQWIVDPGGKAAADAAVVGTLRLEWTF